MTFQNNPLRRVQGCCVRGLRALAAVLWLLASLVTAALAATDTQLTADVMDYNAASGEFIAHGNVQLRREGVTIEAPVGRANTGTQKARMWNGVSGYGTHRGEKLSFTCATLTADFAVTGGDYTMNDSVDATFGARHLISDTARLSGQKFSAQGVRHFEDTQRRLVLRCRALSGDYDAHGLHHFEGREDVHVRHTTAAGAETELWSDRLVYVREDNALRATGHPRAVQSGRKIFATELIYFPATGKLKATGAPRITVDMTKMSRPVRRGPKEKRR